MVRAHRGTSAPRVAGWWWGRRGRPDVLRGRPARQARWATPRPAQPWPARQAAWCASFIPWRRVRSSRPGRSCPDRESPASRVSPGIW